MIASRGLLTTLYILWPHSGLENVLLFSKYHFIYDCSSTLFSYDGGGNDETKRKKIFHQETRRTETKQQPSGFKGNHSTG